MLFLQLGYLIHKNPTKTPYKKIPLTPLNEKFIQLKSNTPLFYKTYFKPQYHLYKLRNIENFKMKKKNIQLAILTSLVLTSIILSLSFVSATPKLFCLEDGEKIKFSLCNEQIPDYLCTSTSCQVCADEISSGVFCPASPSICQNQNEACEPWEDQIEEPVVNPPVVTLISPENNYFQEESSLINFVFSVSNAKKIDPVNMCKLIISEVEVPFEGNRIQSGTNKISYLAPQGAHNWLISCDIRDSLQLAQSEERTILINSEAPPEDETPDETPEDQIFNITILTPPNGHSSTGAQEITFTYNINE